MEGGIHVVMIWLVGLVGFRRLLLLGSINHAGTALNAFTISARLHPSAARTRPGAETRVGTVAVAERLRGLRCLLISSDSIACTGTPVVHPIDIFVGIVGLGLRERLKRWLGIAMVAGVVVDMGITLDKIDVRVCWSLRFWRFWWLLLPLLLLL